MALLFAKPGDAQPNTGSTRPAASAVPQNPTLATNAGSQRADSICLSLDSARSLALRANPELRAARLEIDIARGELRQAGLLVRDNPEVDLLTRGQGPELGIAQQVEIAGQRGARRESALAGLDRASEEVTDVARSTLGEVDRSFFRFAAADRRAALADEILTLTERLADASQRQLQAGEISRLEYNLAIVEFGRSRGRALAAQREREEVASELRRLLGLSTVTMIVPLLDSTITRRAKDGANVFSALSDSTATVPRSPAVALVFDVDSLTALALLRRPDLAERTAAVRETSAQVSMARREAFPNLVLRVSSERIEGSGKRQLRPGLGFTFPAFNRNQGEVQARRAAARQADLSRAGLEARVRAEVSRAIASYRSAAAEAEVLATTVLAPARENRRLLEVAFREGKVGLPVLLLIRNQVIDAELEYWEAWLAEREALADLAEATGETVVGFSQRLTR